MDKSSIPLNTVVKNEDILEYLKKIEAAERIPLFTEDEIMILRSIVQERQAYRIVFSKGRMVLGVLATVILSIMSFFIDWHHLITILRNKA